MRETRSYGSARGVRSNPYPYRDPIPPDAVGGALLTNLGTGLGPPPRHPGQRRIGGLGENPKLPLGVQEVAQVYR